MLTATLQHGDNVTVFTTQTAFANAYAAAVDGDVITLSPGQFNATNLTKSVNIYGTKARLVILSPTHTTHPCCLPQSQR